MGTLNDTRRGVGLLRELRSLPTILLLAFCLAVVLPGTIALTPGQEIVVFGQHITVGARPPAPSLAGPARLVQVGNTPIDVDRVRVYGPMRPQVTLGPVQRNAEAAVVFDPQAGPAAAAAAGETVAGGFIAWYLWGGLGLLVATLVSAAAAAGLRTLVALRRHSRAPLPLQDLWSSSVRATGRMTVFALTTAVLAWAACGGLAYDGVTNGLQGVTSLTQLVGTHRLPPAPAGPTVTGYTGAVIGDSRAVRVGGPPLPAGPSSRPDDATCQRSTDSLAAEVGELAGARVLNLACPQATVANGLRGPQDAERGQVVAPQVGVLKQVQGLRFVVVAIGPNDVGWADFLRYCYGVDDCADQLTQGEFDYRLAAFDEAYGDLLADLADLPAHPQVIVVTSYAPFAADPPPDCPDTKAQGHPGLDATKIARLDARNEQLNGVLATGAQKYGFAVAKPGLAPLCAPSPGGRGADGLGPDIQGLADPFPFHPTGVGSLRMASSVVRLIDPPRLR